MSQSEQYLREHRICELLEEIVRVLLRDQPEEPLLAVCRFLSSTMTPQGPILAPSAPQSLNGSPREEPTRLQMRPNLTIPVYPSYPSSRVGTPASLPRVKLERDDSARSDASLFSIASVDMVDFLTEFRNANVSLFGSCRRRISRQDLCDIMDRVANTLPLPDNTLFISLFSELVDSDDKVSFDAFLARMGFRIQGKYSSDTLHSAYYTLLESESEAPAADAAPRSSTPNAALSGKNLLQDMAASSTAASSTPGRGIPIHRCPEGMWRLLGLRVTTEQLSDFAKVLQLPAEAAVTVYLSDFERLAKLSVDVLEESARMTPAVTAIPQSDKDHTTFC